MIKNTQIRIGLDLDDCIFEFMSPYLKKFGVPKNDYEITRNVQRILIQDKDFWLNQSVIHRPDFTPILYCTKRVHRKKWTKEQLIINNLPLAPIYQVYSQTLNKATRIKGRVDVFVDDSVSNMIAMNLSGLPCLLLDSPNNQDWIEPVGRVYSLDKEEIEEAYHLFKETMFPYFKEFIKV